MAEEKEEKKEKKEACKFDENTQTVSYVNSFEEPSISFNFVIKRQKSTCTNKERLVITAREIDNTLMGEITTDVPNLQEGLLRLREYGVVAPRAVYGKVAKMIEQNYLNLTVEKIEFENVLTDDILINIIVMVKDYIDENTSNDRTYEGTVKDKECYNIPVGEFADIFKDSEYNIFELVEIKKKLKVLGYSICSTGRYDRTIYNAVSKKTDKVICIDKKLLITTLPTLPDEET